jgi:hypothetical protein
MNKYEFLYQTSDGEVNTGWCYASSILDAERTITYEKFDVDSILAIRQL